jgi:hypothetical protein
MELTKKYSKLATDKIEVFRREFSGVTFQFCHQELKKLKQIWMHDSDQPNSLICRRIVDKLKGKNSPRDFI